jgi:hypothetical protein
MENPTKIDKELQKLADSLQELADSAFSITFQDGDTKMLLKFLEKMTSEYFRPCYELFITSVFYNFELRLQKILEENKVHTPWQEKFPDQYERFKKLKNKPDENLRAALAEILTKALINGSVEIRKAIE